MTPKMLAMLERLSTGSLRLDGLAGTESNTCMALQDRHLVTSENGFVFPTKLGIAYLERRQMRPAVRLPLIEAALKRARPWVAAATESSGVLPDDEAAARDDLALIDKLLGLSP